MDDHIALYSELSAWLQRDLSPFEEAARAMLNAWLVQMRLLRVTFLSMIPSAIRSIWTRTCRRGHASWTWSDIVFHESNDVRVSFLNALTEPGTSVRVLLHSE